MLRHCPTPCHPSRRIALKTATLLACAFLLSCATTQSSSNKGRFAGFVGEEITLTPDPEARLNLGHAEVADRTGSSTRWSVDGLLLRADHARALGSRPKIRVVVENAAGELVLADRPLTGAAVVKDLYLSASKNRGAITFSQGDGTDFVVLDLQAARAQQQNRFGVKALRAKNWVDAEAAFQRAAAADPRSGDGAYNLACLFSLRNDPEQARAWLEVALSIDRAHYQRLAEQDPDLESLR